MAELPIAPCRRLLTQGGAERVTEDASKYLAAHLEEQAIIIASTAANLASHAGRKTVKVEDLEMAVKTLYE